MAQPERVVKTIMERFKVTNGTTVGLAADLVERLIHRQQLVEHVTIIRLLFANAFICCIVAAGGINSISIDWKAHRVVPVLELELTL